MLARAQARLARFDARLWTRRFDLFAGEWRRRDTAGHAIYGGRKLGDP